MIAPELVRTAVTVAARHVRPGDEIELPDRMTGRPVRHTVADVVAGWVWVAGVKLDTVLLVTDPATGRGPVVGADDVVDVVDYRPDQTDPAEVPDVPELATVADGVAWW